MLVEFIEWTTNLHKTDRLLFAIVTIITMAVCGAAIAIVVELVMKLMGIGEDKT
ncbi:MAG: hypothetical protein N2Z40_06815 [Caldimicrobium sp.]|nr:hypothetical protein [Caldimicrobium sp.]MCX7613912.1 hypothetical protein [Caldimicrobium sp.]MDW8183462.1 hypothetical protein [Caldimicrobium sp.]